MASFPRFFFFNSGVLVFVLSYHMYYYIIFIVNVPQKLVCFRMTDRWRDAMIRGEMGGSGRNRVRASIFRIDYVRKKMFSIKEENAISCILSTVRVATLIVFSEKRSV